MAGKCKRDGVLLFEKRVHEISCNLDGKFGLFVSDLEGGWESGLRQDELFPTASVFKIFVMAAAFRQSRDGTLDLEELVSAPERAADAGGLFAPLSVKPVLTVLDHIKLMIIYSDNCSTDVLLDMLGKEYVNDTIKSLGLTRTHVGFSTTEMHYRLAGMQRLKPTPENDRKVSRRLLNQPLPGNHITVTDKPGNNVSTPRETAGILARIYGRCLISDKYDRIMLDILKSSASRETFGRYLPPEIPVAHKEGAFRRMQIDAGIVFFPGRPFVFSCFCRDLPFKKNYLGMDAIAATGRELYNLVRGKRRI